ncbi:MAG: hypothetical protein WAV31_06125 [Candidatus Moraniibacteriota bacterium]
MRISVTGTFTIKRSELEAQLKAAGHEIVSLSGKTEILLVGEKTASKSKIQKAKNLNVRVLEEMDADKILVVVSGQKKLTLVSTQSSDYYSYREIDGSALQAALWAEEDGEGDTGKVFESFGFVRLDDCEDPPEEPSQRITIQI